MAWRPRGTTSTGRQSSGWRRRGTVLLRTCTGTVLALYCRYDLYWHWRSKAADNFRLIASDGSVFVGENGVGGVYTLNDLEDWIATKTNMVEIPNLVYLDII